MKILYNANAGFVVSIGIDEPEMLLRTIGVLIEAFKEDCDVSSLREVAKMATEDLQHTVQ